MLTLQEVLEDARCSGDFDAIASIGVNTSGATGITPLHFVATLGDVKAARLLLDAGAHIDAMDQLGATPLHEAIQLRHEPLVRLLIERGASRNLSRADGKTALSLAVESKSAAIIAVVRDAV